MTNKIVWGVWYYDHDRKAWLPTHDPDHAQENLNCRRLTADTPSVRWAISAQDAEMKWKEANR